MNHVEYLAKVLNMVETSIRKPILRDEPKDELFECELCGKEVIGDELTMIEFRKRDVEVCPDCFENPPEEYPEEDRDDLGGR